MLKNSIPIGKIFGIPLKLHFSWFLIFILVTWSLAAYYFPEEYPDWTLSTKIAAGILTSLLFFASVMAHELMHSIVALREGMQIKEITLFVLGGVSQITTEPKKPKDEFWMAIAGPGSSLILGILFLSISYTLDTSDAGPLQFISAITFWLGYINIALAVFNLIPGFPLDGGRVLRSSLWWLQGNLHSATRIASTVGRVIGFLFIFAGIWIIFVSSAYWFNGIWFIIIGWFLESAASGTYRELILKDMLKGHTASEVMSRDCQIVSPETSIESLVNEHILTSGRRCFPVVSQGRFQGLITLHNIKAVSRHSWATKQVKEVMTPIGSLKSVPPDEDLNAIMQILSRDDINQVPVVQDGNVIGIVGRDNIISFINLRGELEKR